jgi:hypothetical protein
MNNEQCAEGIPSGNNGKLRITKRLPKASLREKTKSLKTMDDCKTAELQNCTTAKLHDFLHISTLAY